jgi:hypothetical protein
MEKFVDILRVGGKTNSLGRANEVIDVVLGDKSLLDELYESLFDDDAWVRMRTADCLEKICRVHPDWVEPFMNRMLDDLTASGQPSIQWHLAQIFAEVNLTSSQKKRAIMWLKDVLSADNVDWIVSVNTMKTLVKFHRDGLVRKDELVPLFELQQQHKSNTVQKKAAQFLQDL